MNVVTGGSKSIIESLVTSGRTPHEVLERLDSYQIDWYVTEQGTLMIRYWQVGAERFMLPEHTTTIRNRQVNPDAANLEWVSANLDRLRAAYGGQWIAVSDSEVVASSTDLQGLLKETAALGVTNPFITQIPAAAVVWTTAYAG